MAKEMSWMCGSCSAVGRSGSGRTPCASSTRGRRCSCPSPGSSTATPSAGSARCTACLPPTTTTIGKPWRESSSNPAWTRLDTMSSELTQDPKGFLWLRVRRCWSLVSSKSCLSDFLFYWRALVHSRNAALLWGMASARFSHWRLFGEVLSEFPSFVGETSSYIC